MGIGTLRRARAMRAAKAVPAPAPVEEVQEAPDVDVAMGADVAFRVEQNGVWFKLIGPDGQVGKSQRSEADAWALLGVSNGD